MKNFTKGFLIFVYSVLLAGNMSFAENDSLQSGFSFWMKTEGAYYFKSDYKTGKDHFAKPTGIYDGAEIRSLVFADYKIPTPLGEHFLLKDANVVLRNVFELTPVSVRLAFNPFFWPFPFLGVDAGATIGSGWNYFDFHGLSVMNKNTKKWKELDAFSEFYYSFWLEGIFQFDFGFLVPSDWTHIVMQTTYQVFYAGLTGVSRYDIWEWQESENQAEGLQYSFCEIIAYQMPLMLYRIGLMMEFSGHFSSSDYGEFSESYNGDFMKVSTSLFTEILLSDKDSFIVLAGFGKRRSFSTEHKNIDEEVFLTATGDEWFFERIALRLTHNF